MSLGKLLKTNANYFSFASKQPNKWVEAADLNLLVLTVTLISCLFPAGPYQLWKNPFPSIFVFIPVSFPEADALPGGKTAVSPGGGT